MGFFEDPINADSRYSLSEALGWAEMEFRDDFEDRWGLDASKAPDDMGPDEWLRAKKLAGLAEQIASVAASMLRMKGLGPGKLALPEQLDRQAREQQIKVDEILDVVERECGWSTWSVINRALLPSGFDDPRTDANVFWNSLQLQAARLIPYEPAGMASRMYGLTKHLVQHRDSRSTAFLNRLAKCYILGMNTEFTVMARAVLDAALQEAVDDEKVVSKVGPQKDVTLDSRIRYFEACGVFDRTTAEAARRVKRAGDIAVHDTPGLEPEPDVMLDDLVAVFVALGSDG